MATPFCSDLGLSGPIKAAAAFPWGGGEEASPPQDKAAALSQACTGCWMLQRKSGLHYKACCSVQLLSPEPSSLMLLFPSVIGTLFSEAWQIEQRKPKQFLSPSITAY